MPQNNVVLLGDSILDNRPYTAPEPDTAAHLQARLGEDWSVDLVARDGATMRDMPRQLELAPGRSATAVLSIGGNDLLGHVGLLTRPSSAGAASVLEEILAIADDFGGRYENIARAVAARFERTVVCTIYEVQLEPPNMARLARVPLGVMNDRIIRTAARLGLDVLELREVCAEPSDFVLQIEPSSSGAAKIAAAIAAVLRQESSIRTGRIHTAA
jgi:lysophospholipase L1-like esterase